MWDLEDICCGEKEEDMKATVIFFAVFLFVICLSGISYAIEYEGLAGYWAPVFCQDIDNANVRADYITNFNYDGNWTGNDNWNNLNNYPLRAHIYYWVIETETHYFIGYAFFHPRDWSSRAWCGGGVFNVEHENDMEGILLTIKKSSDPSCPFGQFVAMVTVAHTHFFSYTEQEDYSDLDSGREWNLITSPSRPVESGVEDIDADMDFVADDFGFHPVVYSQSEGHGVFGFKEGGDMTGYGVTDYPPIFDRNTVTDWRGVNWIGIIEPPYSGDPSSTYSTSRWNDGIIYHYENSAEVPTDYERYGYSDYPQNWEVVGYDLISIRDLWDRRFDYEGDGDEITFDRYGVFNGNCDSHFSDADSANPPWGWNDSDDGPVSPPDFFMDPAFLVDQYFNGPEISFGAYTGSSFANKGEYIFEKLNQDRNIFHNWNIKIENATEVDIFFDRVGFDSNNYNLFILNGYDYNAIARYTNLPPAVLHADTNNLLIGLMASNCGEYGFSIHIKANSPPTLVEEPVGIEINECSYDLNIGSYVNVIDPEGGPIEYNILEWSPFDSVAPWRDGFYEGALTVNALDKDGNSTTFQVPITVNNVSPSPSCDFQEGDLIMAGNHPTRLEPEEHNINIRFTDPGEYDYPWQVTVDFGDGSSLYRETVLSLPYEKTIHHPYEPGNYTVRVHVTDKDGGEGSAECEFSVRYTESEARDRNASARAEQRRLAERITIIQQGKEMKRFLGAKEIKKPKKPGWIGESSISQSSRIQNEVNVSNTKINDVNAIRKGRAF